MARLAVGEKMLDFTAAGAFGPEEALSSRVGKGKTAIVFLRYYGCTLCQYDIHTYAEHYQEIVGDTGKLFVVLQSTPESIKKQMTRETPEGKLYKEFEINPAKDKEELGGGNVVAKVTEARKLFSHGDYEGEELQLPAAFVVKSDLTITYAKYGKDGADVPTPQELEQLLK
jgi:peroxiredoxin